MTQNSRRKFIAKTSATLAGLPLITHNWLQSPPSDRIRVAHVGVNGMGKSHLRWFAAMKDVETVALCDVDSRHLGEAEKIRASMQPRTKAEVYEDYRRIIDRKDNDVVTCATPDHWHALIAIHAFETGKDVYGEKPLSYSIREGKAMLAAKKKYRSVFQHEMQVNTRDK